MNPRVISFHYTVVDGESRKIDSSEGRAPLTILEGAGQIITGLERELSSLKEGDARKLTIPAADAYGERIDSLVSKVERERFPKAEIQVGERFRGGEEGGPVLVVSEVSDSHVTLDANHPLAGQDLTFDVRVMQVRQATDEEMQHGHAHGEHGHSH